MENSVEDSLTNKKNKFLQIAATISGKHFNKTQIYLLKFVFPATFTSCRNEKKCSIRKTKYLFKKYLFTSQCPFQ